MDENQQIEAESKLIATNSKLWLPPLSPNDQKKLERLRNNSKKKIFKGTGFASKTLWDWLNLLGVFLVPLMIGVFTLANNLQQSQISQQQYNNNQQNALDQQRETTLTTYLDEISNLVLNYNLNKSKSGDEVGQIARERTISTLRRLDASRNEIVIQFLQDAHLIGGQKPVIDLSNANLSGDDLSNTNLIGIQLIATNLNDTVLIHAKLIGADLSGDILTSANLTGAQLISTNLHNANLSRANLTRADLKNADLDSANLTSANLTSTELDGTILTNAILTNADLANSVVTQNQLTTVKIMPNGSPVTHIPTSVPTQSLIPPLHSSYTGTFTRSDGKIFPLVISSLTEDTSGFFTASGRDGVCQAEFQGVVSADDAITFTVREAQIANCGLVGDFQGQVFSDGHLAGSWIGAASQVSGVWTAF